MRTNSLFRYLIILLILLLPVMPVAASGIFMDGDRLLLQTSIWTRHFSPEPDHDERQKLLNVEWLAPESYRFAWQESSNFVDRASWLADLSWLAGAASFRNSFSQRSTFVYGGARYDMLVSQRTRVYAKVTAGLLHGYRGEHRDKIPFNQLGVAPAVVPAIGLEHRRMNVEMIPFGTAGMMVNLGFYLN